MSDDLRPPVQDGQLREEAANWFAAMRGPDAHTLRPAFEAWLARGALHRRSYNRIAETFALGKMLKDETRFGSCPAIRSAERKVGPILLLLTALVGGSFVLSSAWRSSLNPENILHQPALPSDAQPSVRMLASAVGEIRRVRLDDGSVLTLDTDSLVTIAYSPTARFVRLERGRARFDVVPNNRPFRVDVNHDKITAKDSQFDAQRASDGSVAVSMLRGTVDLYRAADRSGGLGYRPVLRLLAGERIHSSHAVTSSLEMKSPIKEAAWPLGLIDFDQATLADVAAYASRYSTTPIVLADPDLARMKVSGTFKVSDPAKLTAHLAEIFGLAIEPTADAEYRLRRR